MGGRVAEELTQDDITTGAGNDIERATDLARRMVCEWGMSELGPLSFGGSDEPVFLGRDFAQRAELQRGHRDSHRRRGAPLRRRRPIERARDILTAAARRCSTASPQELLERESLDGERGLPHHRGDDRQERAPAAAAAGA